ncbi:MAG: DUF349 domain-containing protein, partial [Porticoccaceae bacterium]|nr:DUF349 domain-containing protein [Porticoccaceae bacterium]
YAASIADSVLEGKAQSATITSKDEFVEVAEEAPAKVSPKVAVKAAAAVAEAPVVAEAPAVEEAPAAEEVSAETKESTAESSDK